MLRCRLRLWLPGLPWLASKSNRSSRLAEILFLRQKLPRTVPTGFLWWASPAGSEPGWGITLTHQGDIIFATWFTYGTDGQPLWLTVEAPRTGGNVFSGFVRTFTGPAFNAVPFDPARVTETIVGAATFTFADGNNATFAYTVGSVAQTKPITRQVFAAPGTVCH